MNNETNTANSKENFLSKILGFRSNTGWKKVVSIIYAFLSVLMLLSGIFSMDSVNDAISTLMIFALSASPYIFMSDFTFRSRLPLFKDRKPFKTFLGLLCVWLIIIIFFSLINPANYCEHNWKETNRVDATCTEDGLVDTYCKLCDSTNTETIPKTGHSFENNECKNCGKTASVDNDTVSSSPEEDSTSSEASGSESDRSKPDSSVNESSEESSSTPSSKPSTSSNTHTHSYTAATCTAPKTCSSCGATSGNAKGHSWTGPTCTAPKTCSVCGTTTGGAKGHSWAAATYTKPKTCSSCGITEGSALPVPYSENYHGHVYKGGDSSKNYHYEANCAGKYSHEISWDEVLNSNLGPCGTCVLK